MPPPISARRPNLEALSVLAFKFSFVFALLFMMSLPFGQPLLPNIGAYTAPYFEPLLKWIGDQILGWQQPYTYRLMSDSSGLYIHLVLLLFLSSNLVLIWTLLEKKGQNYLTLRYWFQVICSYFLAMHLLSYGFNKIFKVQFFLPEPNTLFTPLGQLSHDLVFWSSMGSSYPYTFFSGLVEIIPALLLFFRRTRLIGAFIALGVMVNVLMLNLGFDISVKVFSSFLLFLCLVLIGPQWKNLYQFFILQKMAMLQYWHPTLPRRGHYSIKTIVILWLVANGLYPYIRTGNFNDDLAERPYLHGAYEVENFVFDGDTLAPSTTDKLRWRRIFVHRRNYFIVQNMQDKMKDFKLLLRPAEQQLELRDYDESVSKFQFNYADSILQLDGRWKGHRVQLRARQLNLEQLPLLRPQFHWSLDAL